MDTKILSQTPVRSLPSERGFIITPQKNGGQGRSHRLQRSAVGFKAGLDLYSMLAGKVSIIRGSWRKSYKFMMSV